MGKDIASEVPANGTCLGMVATGSGCRKYWRRLRREQEAEKIEMLLGPPRWFDDVMPPDLVFAARDLRHGDAGGDEKEQESVDRIIIRNKSCRGSNRVAQTYYKV